MRNRIVWLGVVFLVLALSACTKQPGDNAAATAEPATSAVSDEQLAGHLKPAEVTPAKPLDQSSPHAALASFFEALMIALDPAFQAADKQPELEPHRAKAYLEALTRLRKLFVERGPNTQIDPNTEVIAYLDLIRIKKAEIVGESVIEGNVAKVKVTIIKGIDADHDPRAFGENSSTEATAEVVLVKVENDWKIKDFGGLVTRARSNLQRQ